MESIIKELWHGNIIPQEDSRTNLKEMKELLGYMARHHEDLEKSFTDEQKEIFEKFHDCWSEYHRKTILRYVQRKYIYGVKMMGKYYISKNSIINYLATDKAFKNTQKTPWRIAVIERFLEKN